MKFIIITIILWNISALLPESRNMNQGSSLRHLDFVDRSVLEYFVLACEC